MSFHKKRASEHIPEALLAGHLGPSSSRGRLPHTAHPSIRPTARNALRRALPTNGAPAPGRGDRGAYRAHLRADLGKPGAIRKESQRRGLSGTRACPRSVGREGPSEAHLQGRRRDVEEAPGGQRSLHPWTFWLRLGPKTPRTEDRLPRRQELKETRGGGRG